jgi:hypothetical protein
VLNSLGLGGSGLPTLPGLLQVGNGGNPFPASLQQKLIAGLTRTGQFKRCPGSGDVVAPDKSNLLSSSEQQTLGCTEADRGAGAYTPGQ